jgi:predicted NUDIX family NTP pyrophosphohydrolase
MPISNAERLAQAVLLFHRGGPWTALDSGHWLALTGKVDCTTKVLCDLARRILETAEREVVIQLPLEPLSDADIRQAALGPLEWKQR